MHYIVYNRELKQKITVVNLIVGLNIKKKKHAHVQIITYEELVTGMI